MASRTASPTTLWRTRVARSELPPDALSVDTRVPGLACTWRSILPAIRPEGTHGSPPVPPACRRGARPDGLRPARPDDRSQIAERRHHRTGLVREDRPMALRSGP